MRRYLPELDGLRGIAILLVMVHRLFPRAIATPWYVDAGWIGVDLFFVISGFLITGILVDTRDDPDYFKNFYARRVLRIFPLFYLFVGGMLVAAVVAGAHGFFAAAGSPAWYVLQLGNVPEAVLGKDPPYWLAPVWSLAIEEQFYLTFPWLVRVVDRRRLAWWLATFALVALATRALTTLAFPDNERLQYQLTPCRLDAIAAGCAIALLVRAERFAAWWPRLRPWLGAVMIGAVAVALVTQLDRTTAFGRTFGYTVVAAGFAALVLHVVCTRDGKRFAVLRFAPLRYLGKLCFGLYLLHRPADTLVAAAVTRLGLDAASIAWIPVKIAVAVGLATLSWVVLELPFLRRKTRFVVAGVVAAGCHGSPAAPIATPDAGRDALIDSAPRDAALQLAPIEYPLGVLHSPITSDVAANLTAIARGHAGMFAKVGDSITASTSFLDCFTGPVDLGAHGELATSLAYFQGAFARTSVAAVGGWTAADPLAGSPCPLDSELQTIDPRFAVVMLGTNDDRYGRTLDAYGSDLWTIVDRTIARGVVPILSTIPAIHGDPGSDARVALFDGVVRALAQGRMVPLVDYHLALAALPDEGIGSDGLHPTVSPDGACVLDAAYGYNARNLVTLEALDRARRAVLGEVLDASAARRVGSGRNGDPVRATLPLAQLGDTRGGDPTTACGTTGRGLVYRVELAAAATLEAYVVDRDPVDVDVSIVQGGCLANGDASAVAAASAGTVYIVVASRTPATAGEFLLVARAR